MDALAPILRLPPEITDRIAAFLSVPDPDTNAGGGSSPETYTANAMSAEEMLKRDFCALRLTCKDLYFKTFRLFSRYYFTTVSVGFNRESLDRLRALANYKNVFGLTLIEFTSHLTVSTLRLLPESEVHRIFSFSDPQEDAQDIVAAINMLCELGVESYHIPGTYNPDTYAIAGKYRKAVASQQSLTTSSCDINKIARAIATFPKFCSIYLDAYDKSWGEEDWQEIAGFDRRVFTSFGDIHSGQKNLEFTLNRVLQAIAQAEMICQANRRTFNLCSLSATALYGSEDWDPESHQNIKLQRLDIHPFSRVALQAAFSRLTSLSIDIYDFFTPDEPKDSSDKIKEALTSTAFKPQARAADNRILAMVAEKEQSNGLERLGLFCQAIVKSKAAVEKLVKKHAATLEALSLEILIPDPGTTPPNVFAERIEYKGLLRILTGCPLLEEFSFHVEPVADEWPVADFDMNGREWIMKRVNTMITSHTRPEHDYFWGDGSEAEDNENDDS